MPSSSGLFTGFVHGGYLTNSQSHFPGSLRGVAIGYSGYAGGFPGYTHGQKFYGTFTGFVLSEPHSTAVGSFTGYVNGGNNRCVGTFPGYVGNFYQAASGQFPGYASGYGVTPGALAASGVFTGYTHGVDSIYDDVWAYYRFEDNLDDSSGYKRDLNNVAASYTGGKFNQGLGGGGGSRQPLGGVSGSSPFTVSAWFHSPLPSASGAGAQISVSGHRLLYAQCDPAGTVTLRSDVAGGLISATSLGSGQWLHGALTFTGGMYRLYAAGVESVAGAGSAPDWNSPFAVLATGSGITSRVDEASVYGRSLSAREIDDLYNGGAGVDPTLPYQRRSYASGLFPGVTSGRGIPWSGIFPGTGRKVKALASGLFPGFLSGATIGGEGSVVIPYGLLMEDGFYLLSESETKILLED